MAVIATLPMGAYDMDTVETRIFLRASVPRWVDDLMNKQINQLRAYEQARGEMRFNFNLQPGEPVGWVFDSEERKT